MVLTAMIDGRSDTALCALAPAKINLLLDVLHHRPDGFHEIRSVAMGVELCDELRFETADSSVTLACLGRETPSDASNLVLRGAAALTEASGCMTGAHISLTKRIPVGGGLGGGSSDAATTLICLNRLWQLGLPDDELARIGSTVGSDVPLFFSLPAASISGRGETVRPIGLRWSGYVLLVFAGCEVSTKDVYDAWSPGATSCDSQTRATRIGQAETAAEVMEQCWNALEPAIFRVSPRVASLYEAVRDAGAPQVRISGAGQTAYVLFDTAEEATRFCDKLVTSGIGTGAVVVRSLTVPLISCGDEPWKYQKFASN